jgi:hypothetical protein
MNRIEDIMKTLSEKQRVINAISDLMDPVTDADVAYHNHQIAIFDGKTPEQLVVQGRTDDLIRYLKSLKSGFSG